MIDKLIISDLHLSREDCNVNILLEFIKNNPSETLVLNGDIIDQFAWWRDKGKLYRAEHRKPMKQIRAILKERGTRVYYIIGNHDYFMFFLIPFGWIWRIKIRKKIKLDGVLIEHGDWISLRLFLRGIERSGSYHVDCMMYAERRNKKLVVGHSHHPERLIDNALVFDDGDWVGNNSYVTIDAGTVNKYV